MPLNAAGLNNPFDIDQVSLHHSNPGVGVNPTASTELTDAPYARQSITLTAPVAGVANPTADVTFNLSTSANQNCQFIGLWKGAVYKGYMVPATPYNFTAAASARSFKLLATASISITN